MPLMTDSVTLPAAWASYLINGNPDTLEPAERQAADTRLQQLHSDGWSVVGTEDDEPRFTWRYEMYGGTAHGGDVMDYVVLKAV